MMQERRHSGVNELSAATHIAGRRHFLPVLRRHDLKEDGNPPKSCLLNSYFGAIRYITYARINSTDTAHCLDAYPWHLHPA